MKDTEIKEIKELLRLLSLRSSLDSYVIDVINKGLETIIYLEVDNIRLKHRAEYFENKGNK